LVTLVAFVAVMIASLFVTASPASAYNVAITEIRAYDKCVTEGSGWYGAELRAYDCRNTYDQLWRLNHDGQIPAGPRSEETSWPPDGVPPGEVRTLVHLRSTKP